MPLSASGEMDQGIRQKPWLVSEIPGGLFVKDKRWCRQVLSDLVGTRMILGPETLEGTVGLLTVNGIRSPAEFTFVVTVSNFRATRPAHATRPRSKGHG